MVNKDEKNIELIIDALKDSDSPVSGEELAEMIGISRTAVWKTINKLKTEGYTIESGRTGYKLAAVTEKPIPRELGHNKTRSRYYDETDSTMRKAALLIKKGCKNGTTVIAGRQTGGISRSGGDWTSPEGGLYFTRIRTTPIPLRSAGLYCTAVAATVAGTLADTYQINTKVRWPNEITIGVKKIGGVLTQFSGELGTVNNLSTGIGINVNIPDTALPANAASIMQIKRECVSVKTLLSLLLDKIEKTDALFQNNYTKNQSLLLDRCRSRIENIGRRVIITQDGNRITGRVVDIDVSGGLIIEISKNEKAIIYSGEDYYYV